MIGLLENNLNLQMILNQIGVDYKIIDTTNLDNTFDLLIINKYLNETEINIIKKYNISFFVLTNQDVFNLNLSFTNQFIKTLFPSEIHSNEHIDINEKISLINNKLYILNNNICYFSMDVINLFSNYNSKRLNFYSNFERLPNEIVSSNSKGAISRLINNIFIKLYNYSKKEFKTNSFTQKNFFCFRIDTDFSSKNSISNLYKLLNKNNISASWFIDVNSNINFLKYYLEFEKQIFGFHCYNHKIFSNVSELQNDFKTGMELLNKNGIIINSAAGIYGKWNSNLNQLYLQYGVKYSSEFSVGFDTLPFYPIVNNSFSKVLQIPIHPICIGSLKASSYSKEQMINYFVSYINKSIELNQPIMLYHHPLDGNLDVLEYIFNYLKDLNIKNISFEDYFNLWNNKNHQNAKAVTRENHNYIPPVDLYRIRNFDPRHFLQSILFYINSK